MIGADPRLRQLRVAAEVSRRGAIWDGSCRLPRASRRIPYGTGAKSALMLNERASTLLDLTVHDAGCKR